MRIRALRLAAAFLAVWVAAIPINARADNWVWVAGDSALDRNGVYGTKGVAAPTNMPGGRWGAAGETDAAGHLLLFGGWGFPADGPDGPLNDLWKYDGSNWTWISGSSDGEQFGIYGTKGVSASTNVPGAREGAVSWRDASGHLWIFGGYGYASTSGGWLNDLWKYDGTNWTWISGSNQVNQTGSYGTKGVAAPSNAPGAREGAVSWRDASGYLWIFGGYGKASTIATGRLNDLWKYDGTNWTWISGSNHVNQAGSYGIEGVPDSGNTPGGRSGSSAWTDGADNRWLFGGLGLDAVSATGSLNDLWRFDGANWTWIGGSSAVNQHGVYGTQGVASPYNQPGGRSSGTTWRTSGGRVWSYGGRGYNSTSVSDGLGELWLWDGVNWTFMAGDSTGPVGSYHDHLGASSGSTQPGARSGSVAWYTQPDNTLWLLGGRGFDYNMNLGSFGALWARQVSPAPPPDLKVAALSAPSTVGACCASIRVQFTMSNLGSVADACSLGVYLSADTVITTEDALLGSVSVPALGPDGVYSGFLDVALPEFPAGRMFLGAIADRTGVVEESDETNNTRFLPIYDLSPPILSIADVLNDQGGWVRIRFAGSGRDVAGSPTPVLQYEAFRQVDPDAAPGILPAASASLKPAGAQIAGWEFAGAVPAHGEAEYSMVVPTLMNNPGPGGGYSVFFLRATTTTPTEFFDSCVDSGYSVDNLPPAAPAQFVGVPTGGGNALHWGVNREADLAHYRLYRGPAPDFVPGPGNLIAEPADTGYVDVAGAYAYKLSAVDVNRNESAFSAAQINGVVGMPVPESPRQLRLGPATPNPVRESALWQLALPHAAPVRADVHDAAGRRVCRLVDATLEAGYRPLRWDLRDAAGRRVESGTYFLRVVVGARTLGGTLTVVR